MKRRAYETTLLVGADKDAFGTTTKYGRLWKRTEAELARALCFVFSVGMVVWTERRLANVGQEQVS